MNKFEFAFLKSHIKRAIYELETANKLKPGSIKEDLIQEVKLSLLDATNEYQREKENNE